MSIQIEGKNPVLAALRCGRPAEKMYILPSLHKDERIAEIIALTAAKKIPLRAIDRQALDRMAKTPIHQGIIGVFENLPHRNLASFLKDIDPHASPFLALFTEIDFEQNFGAALRTADAAGIDGVIVPPRTNGITPVVERISMGASNYVPVFSESLFPTLKTLKDNGFTIVGVETKAKTNYFDINLTGPLVLVIGGEDRGVTEPIQKRCDVLIKIPQKGHISSLNLSVAFGIVAFEKVRQEMELKTKK